MEGTICNLPEIIRIKQQYGCYLFLDEAHSIGALGQTGRGVCEYYNIDPKNVDIMMGTFTKSFGGAGGYIGGNHDLINYLRNKSHGAFYAVPMPPPVVGQVIAALKLIGYSNEGQTKIKQLAKNTIFFRQKLKSLGYYIFGDDHSPVVPLLTCELGKMIKFHELGIKNGLAVVVVAFPATPLSEGRIRFCLSASHTLEDLELACQKIDMIGKELGLNYFKRQES